MNEVPASSGSVIVERDVPHPPDKVWRALTQPHLIVEWLADIDFQPVPGHQFAVRIDPQPGRSFVFECEVTAIEHGRVLAYSWNTPADGNRPGLATIVTWRLTPVPGGTRLRMEQSGFRADQPHFYHGASMGWPRFIARLEALLARPESG